MMTRIDCAYESDVLMMVATGQWPDRSPVELRAHAASCEICGEVAMAASAIETEAASVQVPALPSAGTVWWRAKLRARREAARDVVRPITLAQAAGLAALAGVGGAVFGASASWFQGALRTVGRSFLAFVSSIELPSLPSPSLPEDLAAIGVGYWIILAVVAIGIVTAAALMSWAMKEE